jgi:hypothetical protein
MQLPHLPRIVRALALLSLAALAASGCGGSDDGSSTSTSASTSSTATTDTVDTTAAETTGAQTTGAETTAGATTGTEEAAEGRLIVAGASIGAARLDMSREELEAALGEPQDEQRSQGEIGGPTIDLAFPDDLEVRLSADDPQEVTSVETTSDDYATASGIGVGTSMADLQREYPRAECDPPGEIRICRVGGSTDLSKPVTDFFVSNDAVTRVSIGYIVD